MRPGDEIVDLLFDGDGFTEFPTPRIAHAATRTAPAARSPRRSPRISRSADSLPDATAQAQAYVAGAIRHGLAIGHGHGPLDHFWQMRPPRPAL